MPPRGNEGLDFTPILTQYVFLATSVLALVGWITAFAGQIATDVQFGRGAVNVLWFAIFLQAALIAGVLYTLASDSISMHRFQISVFGAIAIVFAIDGVNAGLFSPAPAANAMGAGWFLLTLVDIIWVLYFTSEEDSLSLYIFNSFGTGGLTSPSRRRRTIRGQGSHNISENNGYATNYVSGGVGSHNTSYDAKMDSGPAGSAAPGLRSQHSFGAGSGNADGTRSQAGGGSIGQSNAGGMEPHSPLMGGGAAGLGAGGGVNLTDDSARPAEYQYKARAMYSYTASADDASEMSFTKGEILDIVDQTGKWWQARKSDGSTGIAPSNYLQVL